MKPPRFSDLVRFWAPDGSLAGRDLRVNSPLHVTPQDPLCGVFEEVDHPSDLELPINTRRFFPALERALRARPPYGRARSDLKILGPMGYKINSPEFQRFIACLQTWVSAEREFASSLFERADNNLNWLAAVKKFDAMSAALRADWDIQSIMSKILKLARAQRPSLYDLKLLERKASRTKASFEKMYGSLAIRLWSVAHWPGTHKTSAPYFNPLYFPRTPAGRIAFFQVVDSVLELYGLRKGESAGARRGTRALSIEEQRLVERVTKKAKGTENGSARMLGSRIAEQRSYTIRREGRSLPALTQAVKRHRRRRGL